MELTNSMTYIGSNSYEKLKTFKYLDSLLTNQNSIRQEINFTGRSKAGNSYYYFSPNTFVFSSSLH